MPHFDLIRYLPFCDISDSDLLEFIAGDFERIPYEHLRFDPLDAFDKFNFDLNPDNHIDIASTSFYSNQYIDVDECGTVLKSLENGYINIMSHNIRSIPKNIDEFLIDFNILSHHISILAFTETRLSEITECLYEIPHYQSFHNSRNTMGGGVALYVTDRLNARIITEFTIKSVYMETIAITLLWENHQYIIFNIYRPPAASLRLFVDALDDTLQRLVSKYINEKIVIIGDFNVDLLRINNGSMPLEFLSAMYSIGCIPQILQPTRITGTSATLIDHIWVNDLSGVCRSGIIRSTISDHFPVFLSYSKSSIIDNSTDRVTYTRRLINDVTKQRLTQNLSLIDWSSVADIDCLDEMYNRFIEVIVSNFNTCIPLVVKRKKKIDVQKPYITPELKILIKEKHRLQRLYVKWPITYEKRFKDIRNRVNKKVKEAKSRYYQSKIRHNKNSGKNTWRILNDLTGRKKNTNNNIVLSVNGDTITDPVNVADAFNSYFANVGELLAGNMQDSLDFNQYLDNIDKNTSFKFEIPTVQEVRSIVKSMKEASPGHDGLPMFVIRDNIDLLDVMITLLCSQSMVKGVVPRGMKLAKVVCIHKADDPREVSNYRPISVLPVISKILERLIYNRLMDHLVQCNHLTSRQYGFRPKCSTEGALHDMCTSLYNEMDNGNLCIGVFLDLSKAFDTIDRQILRVKLHAYGVRDVELDWFNSYFRERQQYVSVGGKKSCYRSISYGTAQGSILGPLIFIVFINDIVYSSNLLKFIMFADDTNVFLCSDNMRTLFNNCNRELKKVYSWMNANKLTLNFKKTNYVIFHRAQKSLQQNRLRIRIGNKTIDRAQNTKFLGVKIDEHLTFKSHISLLIGRLSKYVAIFYRIRDLLDRGSLLLIYKTLIYPNLIYCNSVWGATYVSVLKPLVVMQKKIVRVMCYRSRLDHTGGIFNDLKILKIDQIVYYTRCNFIYKSIHSHNYCNLFSYYESEYNTRLSNNRCLILHRSRSDHSKMSIVHNGVKMWNDVPRVVRDITNYCTFKFKLKEYILSRNNQ